MVSKSKTNIRLASFEDTKVIGINSGLADYKLAWNINKRLSIDLVRQDDLVVDEAIYAFFYYTAGENSCVFNLVSTKCFDKYLVDFSPRLDYLLIIRNENSKTRLEAINLELRNIEGIGHAFFLDVNKGKAMHNLLEILELHEVTLTEKIKGRNTIEYIREEVRRKDEFLGIAGMSV